MIYFQIKSFVDPALIVDLSVRFYWSWAVPSNVSNGVGARRGTGACVCVCVCVVGFYLCTKYERWMMVLQDIPFAMPPSLFHTLFPHSPQRHHAPPSRSPLPRLPHRISPLTALPQFLVSPIFLDYLSVSTFAAWFSNLSYTAIDSFGFIKVGFADSAVLQR